MPFVEGAEPYVSAAEVDKDGPAVQQLVPHIARGQVLHGVVGCDQDAVALPDALWTFPVMLDTRCLRREGVFLLVSLSDLQRGEV
ncbi:hypothetical protein, partial [Streptomyces sp. NPDC087787]|uniref:hypothetical protein n=1 Tax=Streptomyces sp. NPDC087787 TaxID=3365803 RepID=UPI003829328C